MKNVKGITVDNVSINDNIVKATLTVQGTVKEAEVNPKWVAEKLSYTVTVAAHINEILGLYGADLRIAIAGRLRKCSGAFVESLRGKRYSLAALDAMIDAATPDTAGSGIKAQAAKLREMLRAMGLSDEQIDKKLNE